MSDDEVFMSHDKDVKELLVAACDVALKWLLWKQSHDYNSLAMKCCDKSIKFFDALEHLEDEVAKLEGQRG